MLLKGKKLTGPKVEIIAIPRDGDNDIIFKACAIRNFDDFTKLCPSPKPPTMIKRGEGIVQNVEDPRYKQALDDYNEKRISWMIINSLRATEDLVWEKVKYEDPNTWKLYKEELEESGFGDYEIKRIVNGVMTANCLDDVKIEEAKKYFLASQEVVQDHPSPNGVQKHGSSGDVANVSVLDPQK